MPAGNLGAVTGASTLPTAGTETIVTFVEVAFGAPNKGRLVPESPTVEELVATPLARRADGVSSLATAEEALEEVLAGDSPTWAVPADARAEDALVAAIRELAFALDRRVTGMVGDEKSIIFFVLSTMSSL